MLVRFRRKSSVWCPSVRLSVCLSVQYFAKVNAAVRVMRHTQSDSAEGSTEVRGLTQTVFRSRCPRTKAGLLGGLTRAYVFDLSAKKQFSRKMCRKAWRMATFRVFLKSRPNWIYGVAMATGKGIDVGGRLNPQSCLIATRGICTKSILEISLNLPKYAQS